MRHCYYCLFALLQLPQVVHSLPLPVGVRINKVFFATHSRREADRLVANGRVLLNGRVANPGDRVMPGDEVMLDGKPVKSASAFVTAVDKYGGCKPASDADFVYIKYWKPRGVVCTTDLRIRDNIIKALKYRGPERLFPVGRLDKDSEGLILLTNDGRLINAIGRAASAKRKLYEVECNTRIRDVHLRQLALGVVITTTAQRDGRAKTLTAPTLPCNVRRSGPNTFSIELKEGRNRQIRRMCEAVGGYTVTRLKRIFVMGIGLNGLLGDGDWCHLEGDDLAEVLAAIADAGSKDGAPLRSPIKQEPRTRSMERTQMLNEQPHPEQPHPRRRFRGHPSRGRGDVK